MPFTIDTSTDFGKRVERRLRDESVAWLTTVDGSGRPFPSPVWFLHEEDGTVLVYSQPNKLKLRNIDSNANVALNFNASEHGEDVIILNGAAIIDESANPAANHDAYLAKYRDSIKAIGMTHASFSAEYSVAVRIILQKVRGH